MLIGMIQLGLICHGSIDNGGSLDIMRFVHFTRRTRTAFAVEQLISCRLRAPNSNVVTIYRNWKSFVFLFKI